jgi:hypothetical protein
MNTNVSDNAKRRPTLVWVISIYTFLSGAWALFKNCEFLFSHSHGPPSPLEEALQNRPPLIAALAVVTSGLSLAAAAALFTLKRSAVPLFIAMTIIGSIGSWWVAKLPALVAMMGGPLISYAMAGFGIIIEVAICAYVYRLAKRGLLK